MTEPNAPKKSSPMRWILLGCGALTLIGILGMSGCAGIFYFIYKGTDPIAATGGTYLQQHELMRKAVGVPVAVKRDWMGWNVQVVNSTGNAYFTYQVNGPAASGTAEVWLTKSGGEWTPQGARFRPAGGSADAVEIGIVPRGSRIHLGD